MFFLFNETSTTKCYTYGHPLSLHGAVPVYLGRSVRCADRGVFVQLKGAANGMAQRLRDFAGRLTETASAVHSASSEISTGSQDLASRTESQAASIEETAASMHEVTTTVKQNADNAQAANQQIGRAACRERVGQYG